MSQEKLEAIVQALNQYQINVFPHSQEGYYFEALDAESIDNRQAWYRPIFVDYEEDKQAFK